MASFRLEWRASAAKELRKIDRQMIPRIVAAVEQLAWEPLPLGAKKLQGTEFIYRIRVGDYRIVYEVVEAAEYVTIVRIRHRKEVYR
ncbi:type II toxin-antitoxin system RelE family toxin [Candidatus Electronema sp. JM]|uniref:type II toxin-antitoxin system RelE family toxin n=1 Tax=Candidatus Electronema sp. JM TaxID=3401571 RepID=UPI003AA816FF